MPVVTYPFHLLSSINYSLYHNIQFLQQLTYFLFSWTYFVIRYYSLIYTFPYFAQASFITMNETLGYVHGRIQFSISCLIPRGYMKVDKF